MPGPRSPDATARAVDRVLAAPGRAERVLHSHHVPARAGAVGDWPVWADRGMVSALRSAGVDAPWTHQVAAAEHAWAGRDVVVSTGTANAKSS